jgi:ATP-dependent Clp protease, protease subunit
MERGSGDNDCGVERHGRNLYLFADINETTVLKSICHITQMEIESAKKPIIILLNSPGGGCYDGFALYDAIRTCQCPIVTVGMGIVASMGYIIYLAGDKRIAQPNARFMNHQISSEIAGKASDIEIERDEMITLEKICLDIISERTGQPVKKIKKEIKVGNKYLSAKEAKEKGVVHEIVEYITKNPKKIIEVSVIPEIKEEKKVEPKIEEKK